MVNRLWYETVMPILWRNPIRKIENQIYHKLGILNIKYNRLNVITLMKVLSILFV
uniref:Uncharacterized protein n=1 Tax=Rhizophagus irregularis (strain DAOM 181602 / DAOM 197198 / MUCL 43194) TaxID=747089 RepID=U9TJB1_RHIID